MLKTFSTIYSVTQPSRCFFAGVQPGNNKNPRNRAYYSHGLPVVEEKGKKSKIEQDKRRQAAAGEGRETENPAIVGTINGAGPVIGAVGEASDSF